MARNFNVLQDVRRGTDKVHEMDDTFPGPEPEVIPL